MPSSDRPSGPFGGALGGSVALPYCSELLTGSSFESTEGQPLPPPCTHPALPHLCNTGCRVPCHAQAAVIISPCSQTSGTSHTTRPSQGQRAGSLDADGWHTESDDSRPSYAAPLPMDEEARQATVGCLLDFDQEADPALQALCELVTHFLEVPIAGGEGPDVGRLSGYSVITGARCVCGGGGCRLCWHGIAGGLLP